MKITLSGSTVNVLSWDGGMSSDQPTEVWEEIAKEFNQCNIHTQGTGYQYELTLSLEAVEELLDYLKDVEEFLLSPGMRPECKQNARVIERDEKKIEYRKDRLIYCYTLGYSDFDLKGIKNPYEDQEEQQFWDIGYWDAKQGNESRFFYD